MTTWERGTLVRVLSGVGEGETWEVCEDHGAFVTVLRGGEEARLLELF